MSETVLWKRIALKCVSHAQPMGTFTQFQLGVLGVDVAMTPKYFINDIIPFSQGLGFVSKILFNFSILYQVHY